MQRPGFWRPGAELERGVGAETTLVANNPRQHLPLSEQRRALPIAACKRGILNAVERFRTVILVGETGSGKTTQLPQFLDDAGWTRDGRCVAITQPRRIAAVTCAQRVAQEMACELGQEVKNFNHVVGFHVRFERKATDATRVLFCTDGSLVRETLRDPLLTKYSVVILDEAHERSLHTDVLIGILKKIMRVRQQLRLIISSATLDAELFREFFNTNMGPQPEIRMPGARGRPDRLWRLENATIVSVPGRTFPVDILHREEPVGEYIRAAVETVHHIHNTENPGDILVFLPGAAEVDTAVEMCRDSDASDGNTIVFLPLYAALPRHMQINAFRPAPRGKRKVVFSTNVAETSVTIVGIKFVVDCGFSRMPYYDAERDYQVLCTTAVSKANAIQRSGRAGRMSPGKCFRLYSEEEYQKLRESSPPEIQRRDISWLVLQLKALSIDDVLHFDFLAPPTPDALMRALENLVALKALDEEGKMTRLGEVMAEFPLEPRYSKALLSSDAFEVEEEMLVAMAMLNVQSPWTRLKSRSQAVREDRQNAMASLAIETGDLETSVNIFRQWESAEVGDEEFCQENFVSLQVLQRAAQLRKSLASFLRRHRLSEDEITQDWDERLKANIESGTLHVAERFARCFLSGFFNNVANLQASGRYKIVRGGAIVQLHPDSVFANFGSPPEVVTYAEVEMREGVTTISDVARIHPRWALDAAPHFYQVGKPSTRG